MNSTNDIYHCGRDGNGHVSRGRRENQANFVSSSFNTTSHPPVILDSSRDALETSDQIQAAETTTNTTVVSNHLTGSTVDEQQLSIEFSETRLGSDECKASYEQDNVVMSEWDHDATAGPSGVVFTYTPTASNRIKRKVISYSNFTKPVSSSKQISLATDAVSGLSMAASSAVIQPVVMSVRPSSALATTSHPISHTISGSPTGSISVSSASPAVASITTPTATPASSTTSVSSRAPTTPVSAESTARRNRTAPPVNRLTIARTPVQTTPKVISSTPHVSVITPQTTLTTSAAATSAAATSAAGAPAATAAAIAPAATSAAGAAAATTAAAAAAGARPMTTLEGIKDKEADSSNGVGRISVNVASTDHLVTGRAVLPTPADISSNRNAGQLASSSSSSSSANSGLTIHSSADYYDDDFDVKECEEDEEDDTSTGKAIETIADKDLKKLKKYPFDIIWMILQKDYDWNERLIYRNTATSRNYDCDEFYVPSTIQQALRVQEELHYLLVECSRAEMCVPVHRSKQQTQQQHQRILSLQKQHQQLILKQQQFQLQRVFVKGSLKKLHPSGTLSADVNDIDAWWPLTSTWLPHLYHPGYHYFLTPTSVLNCMHGSSLVRELLDQLKVLVPKKKKSKQQHLSLVDLTHDDDDVMVIDDDNSSDDDSDSDSTTSSSGGSGSGGSGDATSQSVAAANTSSAAVNIATNRTNTRNAKSTKIGSNKSAVSNSSNNNLIEIDDNSDDSNDYAKRHDGSFQCQ